MQPQRLLPKDTLLNEGTIRGNLQPQKKDGKI